MYRNKKYHLDLDTEELAILQRTHLINILNKVRDNEGIHKRALLMEMDQLYHSLNGLRWLERRGWIFIKKEKRGRGRPKHKLYLTEKSRERLHYLNELYKLIEISLASYG